MGFLRKILQLSVFGFPALFLVGCVSTGGPIYPIAGNLIRCQAVSQKTSSIVGGKAVDDFDPDQRLVAMLKIERGGRRHVCTTALLSDHTLLTAAHCVSELSPSDVEVQFVTSENCQPGQVQKIDYKIADITVHEGFDGSPESFSDIAILRMENPAPKTQIRVPLLSKGHPPTDDEALLLGFGITNELQKDSQTLRRITKSLAQDFKEIDRTIRVDQTGLRGGFCRGDSGAPIFVTVWGEPQILGVNSANIGLTPNTECQTASVAMSTNYFRGWIESKRDKFENRSWWQQLISYVF